MQDVGMLCQLHNRDFSLHLKHFHISIDFRLCFASCPETSDTRLVMRVRESMSWYETWGLVKERKDVSLRRPRRPIDRKQLSGARACWTALKLYNTAALAIRFLFPGALQPGKSNHAIFYLDKTEQTEKSSSPTFAPIINLFQWRSQGGGGGL